MGIHLDSHGKIINPQEAQDCFGRLRDSSLPECKSCAVFVECGEIMRIKDPVVRKEALDRAREEGKTW